MNFNIWLTDFKQLKDLLNDGSINLKVYIDRIVDLYRFEPKKKYIEELEDTDDSDSEIEDDSDESVASEEDEEIDTEATTSRPLIHTEATTSRPFLRIGTQSDEVANLMMMEKSHVINAVSAIQKEGWIFTKQYIKNKFKTN